MKKVFEQRDASATAFSEGDLEGAGKATEVVASEKAALDVEVIAVASRRRFVTSYRRRIVREADACNTPGAIGALLRREGLYSSHLSNWRAEVAATDVAAVEAKPRGPKPSEAKVADRRLAVLEQENAKLRKKLDRAEQIIEVQKKLCDLLGLPTAGDVP